MNGKCVDTTNVNVVLLNEGIGVDTNENKDDRLCPNCGRELVPTPTRGYYCQYCGFQEGTRKVSKAIEKVR